MRFVRVVVLPLLCLAGCQAPQPSAEGEPPVPVLTHLATFGCRVCDSPKALDGVTALFGKGDEVWVGTRSEPHVRVFSLSGSPIRAFGRHGEGPGELDRPQGFMASQDTLLVLGDGGMLVSFAPSDEPGVTRRAIQRNIQATSPAPSGGWLAVLSRHHMETGKGSIFLLNSNGTVVDTIAVPDSLNAGSEQPYTSYAVGHAVSDSGHIVLGYGWDVYRLMKWDGEGWVRTVVHDVAPHKRTPEEMEALRKDNRRIAAMTGREPREPEEYDPHFSDRDIRIDTNGNVWVRTRHGDAEGTTFDVFDRTLRFLGVVKTSKPIGQFGIFDNTLVGVTYDEVAVPYVDVWQIG